MSSKKEKFIESAQKSLLKGQLDRAIKDYEQVVALDPADIRCRQRLAELLVRANRTADAVTEYEAIGKHYADNGFYLKAIAVYKQVQKLDPDSIKTSCNLATLNEKQGLTGNALAEYSRVYSYYDKAGQNAEALDILERMMTIDPDNLNTRLKFAETSCAAGAKDKAYDYFVQVALQLKERGDESAFNQVCSRIRHHFPEETGFALDVARGQLQNGNSSGAVAGLQEVVRKEQGNLQAWQLLAEALRAAGDRDEHKNTLLKMVRLFPEEPSPREGLIQCAFDDGDPDGVLFFAKMHGELLLGKGGGRFLERTFQTLLEQMPDDERVLHGLRGVYKASGEQAKLAEVEARLGALKQGAAGKPAPPREEEIPEVEEYVESVEEVGTEEPEAPVTGDEALDEDAVELSLDLEELPEQEGPAAAGGEEVPAGQEELDEIGIELELGEDELLHLAEMGTQPEEAQGLALDHPEGHTDLEEVPPAGAAPLVTDADFVDLESELFSEIEPEEEAADYDKYSLDGLFSEFKKELGQQLDKEDTETHYNLGIAFREMGLYDDAISEFQAAASDPRRKVDCVALQGICCRDKGDFARGEEILRGGLALPGLAAEQLSPLKYELALLYEASGQPEDALRLYREIAAVAPDFRGIASKVGGKDLEAGDDYEELDLVELDDAELE